LVFRKISLQEQLVTSIEKVIKEVGTYRSIAEFVSEAVRLRIEDIEKQERARKRSEKHESEKREAETKIAQLKARIKEGDFHEEEDQHHE